MVGGDWSHQNCSSIVDLLVARVIVLSSKQVISLIVSAQSVFHSPLTSFFCYDMIGEDIYLAET